MADLTLLSELLTGSVFEACDRCAPIVRGERARTGTPQKYVAFERVAGLLEGHLASHGVARPGSTRG